MKKLTSLLLALAMLLSLGLSAGAEAAGTPGDGETPFVVGSLTQMSGHFFTDRWGNNTSDMDIRALIHGYSTIAWNSGGDVAVDTSVVEKAEATLDGQGNKTYTFTLHRDLAYNDGTPITAKDYVFTALLLSAPQFAALGVAPTTMEHIAGYERYAEGSPFAGVRLLDEYTFSLTIKGEYLPYFYELAYVEVEPYPMAMIAPGCQVTDEGNGASITGPFTEALLREAILTPDTGYLFHPTVTSGPYTLTSFDSDTKEATLAINPLFKGAADGSKPTIEPLVFRHVTADTMMDELLRGEVQLINKVSDFKSITLGTTLMGQQLVGASTYFRSGMSFLSFACEMGPTQHPEVRKAIALCVDVEAFVAEFLTEDFARPVYGYYGLGQWMAQEAQTTLAENWPYHTNINTAKMLLEEGGWNLNSEGQPYDATRDSIRYRLGEDGELEALVVKYAYAKDSQGGEMLAAIAARGLEEAGIGLESEALAFDSLLAHYYRQEDRTFHVMHLATNFNLIFDPYYAFSTSPMYQGVFNTTGIQDEQLMALAQDLRRTEAGDTDTYMEKWLRLQARWVEVLPMVPLYSNTYLDFYVSDLQNYAPNANWSWGQALLYAYMGQPGEDAIE